MDSLTSRGSSHLPALPTALINDHPPSSAIFYSKKANGSDGTADIHDDTGFRGSPICRAVWSFVCVSAIADLFSATKVQQRRHDINDTAGRNESNSGVDTPKHGPRRSHFFRGE